MSLKMGRERRGPLALELWAKQLIDGYPGVTVRNMTTSWRNGLAFCALIHRFRPDLIDYDKLDPSDIIGNCALAFDTAETKLGIPALLDPEDMAAHEVPDRLSVLTYVAQFYNAFKNSEAKTRVVSPRQDEDDNDNLKNRSGDKSKSPSPEKMVVKRKMDVNEDEIMDSVKRNMPKRSIMLSTSNVCSECKNPVFISERILFMKKLYHRTCFSCSNCKNPLNPHVVDVSPDGLLFCVEKTCHSELLKRYEQNANKNSSASSTMPQIENNQQQVYLPNSVKISELPSETSNLNSEINLPSGEGQPKQESNDNNTSIPINVPEPHLSRFGSGRVSAMRAKFDNVDGDGQSQGDIQKSLDKKNSEPLTDVSKNTRLMNFAGALLHTEKETDPSSQNVPLSNHPSDEVICDPNPNNSEKRLDITEEKHTNGEELVSESNIEVHITEEVTSIRDIAVLNVADQFKRFAETPSPESKPENVEENKSLIEEAQLDNAKANLETEIKTDESNELSNESKDLNVPEEISINSELSVSKMESEKNIEAIKEDKEEKTADESKQNKDAVVNPFEEDEPEKAKTPEPEVPVIATPSPLPRKRAPVVPPSPAVSCPPSPVPSPMPRTRNRNKPSDTDSSKKTASTDELWKKKDYYPAELNPFESEEDIAVGENSKQPNPSVKIEKLEPKNPFEDDEDDDIPSNEVPPSPKPRSSTPISKADEVNNNGVAKEGQSAQFSSHNAANFNVPPPRPPPPQPSPRRTVVPKPYNPFEDEDDIGEYEEEKHVGSFNRGADDTSSISSKISDLSSISGMRTPTIRSLNTSDADGHGTTKARSRKSRRAPLPPSMTQPQGDSSSKSSLSQPPTPGSVSKNDMNVPASLQPPSTSTPPTPLKKLIPVSPKLMKGLKSPPIPGMNQPYRKKRRAPPPRRRVEPLPEATIKTEFADLEVKQKELERQGITLESSIRKMMEEDPESHSENSPSEQLDDMIIQLWSIVNEKNDILRRQTELEYLRRGHRLEEMQAELEFKLRILMDTPEDQKQPNQADLEQMLLDQLLKLVDERNEVVEWLDYNRQQDREEDMMLSKSISKFSATKTVEPIPDIKEKSKSKLKSAKKAEAKEKAKEEGVKEKKKDGKLKLGIFSKKKKKTKESEEKSESKTT